MDDKTFLEKNGYILKSNLFKEEEVNKLLKINEVLHSDKKKVKNNLHDFKEAWNVITNEKLLDYVKKLDDLVPGAIDGNVIKVSAWVSEEGVLIRVRLEGALTNDDSNSATRTFDISK